MSSSGSDSGFVSRADGGGSHNLFGVGAAPRLGSLTGLGQGGGIFGAGDSRTFGSSVAVSSGAAGGLAGNADGSMSNPLVTGSVSSGSSIAKSGGGGIFTIADTSLGNSGARGNSAQSLSSGGGALFCTSSSGSAINPSILGGSLIRTDTTKKAVTAMSETPTKKMRRAGRDSFKMNEVVAGVQAGGGRRDSHAIQASGQAKRMRAAVPTPTRRAGRREIFCARAAPEPCRDPLRARARLSRDYASAAPNALAPGSASSIPAGDGKRPEQGAAASIFGAGASDAKTSVALGADAKAPATSIFGAAAANATAPASSIFGAIGAASGSQSAGAGSASLSIFGASSCGASAPTQSLFGAATVVPKASQGLFGPLLAQPSGQPNMFAQAPAQPKARGNARRRGR